MCTAKSLRSANQLNEASKYLLNKEHTCEQQSTSQPVKQSTSQPTYQPTNQPINQQPNQQNSIPPRTISVNANAAGKDKYTKPSLMYEN
jgi:hypothetical protein